MNDSFVWHEFDNFVVRGIGYSIRSYADPKEVYIQGTVGGIKEIIKIILRPSDDDYYRLVNMPTGQVIHVAYKTSIGDASAPCLYTLERFMSND